MVKQNIGKQDTRKSVMARLPIRMANLVRSFFSNLYDSRTNRLATVLMTTTTKRKVQRTMIPGVIRLPTTVLDVAVINAPVEGPSVKFPLVVLIVFDEQLYKAHPILSLYRATTHAICHLTIISITRSSRILSCKEQSNIDSYRGGG